MTESTKGKEAVKLRGELFDGLSADELTELGKIAQPLALKAGQPIFNLGEEARRILLVDSGTVALTLPLAIRGTTQEITVDEKQAGAVVGWSAMVPPYKFTLSGKAAADVQLVALGRKDLTDLFQSFPAIQTKILANLNRVIASRVALLEAVLARNLQRWAADQ